MQTITDYRQLDELVLQTMGWQRVVIEDETWCYVPPDIYQEINSSGLKIFNWLYDQGWDNYFMPSVSTNYCESRLVVEHIVKEGKVVVQEEWDHGSRCEIRQPGEDDSLAYTCLFKQLEPSHPALAICLSFLKYKGVEVNIEELTKQLCQ